LSEQQEEAGKGFRVQRGNLDPAKEKKKAGREEQREQGGGKKVCYVG